MENNTIYIQGLGELTVEEWENLSPKEPLSIIPIENRAAFYVGETDISEDTYLNPYAAKTFSEIYTTDSVDVRINLYGFSSPSANGVLEHRYIINDGALTNKDAQRLLNFLPYAYSSWAVNEYRTAVSCQAGLNRSSLFAAMMLITDGFSAEIAINLIKENRSKLCLVNDHFVDFLVSNQHVIRQAGLATV
jgi:hypothetical protein